MPYDTKSSEGDRASTFFVAVKFPFTMKKKDLQECQTPILLWPTLHV